MFRSETPLTVAAAYGRLSSVETLVAFGANVDAASDEDRTPLMVSAQYDEIDTVRLLLSLNADTTKINYGGETAFQLAKNDEVKQLLLEQEGKTVKIRLVC